MTQASIKIALLVLAAIFGLRFLKRTLQQRHYNKTRPDFQPVPREGLDPYQVLEVETSASPEEIQEAFHRLIKKYSSEKIPKSKEWQHMAQRKIGEIILAYEQLTQTKFE